MITKIQIHTSIPCPSGSGVDLAVIAKATVANNSPVSAFCVEDVEVLEASHQIKLMPYSLDTNTFKQVEEELLEAAYKDLPEIASRIDSQNKADQRFYIEA
jgi:hypothetical protein